LSVVFERADELHFRVGGGPCVLNIESFDATIRVTIPLASPKQLRQCHALLPGYGTGSRPRLLHSLAT
jgi:hypothetical protein